MGSSSHGSLDDASGTTEEGCQGGGAAAAYRIPWGPVGIVLAVELCERLTYYTLAGTQKIYLNKQLGYSPSAAASMNSVFSMLCYLWCLPGGLVADAVGRYRVIVPLASMYAVGTFLVAVSTRYDLQQQLRGLFLVGALLLIPLGTGGIKPNICNFGADQIGEDTEEKRDAQRRFFSYFYMSINVGVMIAFGFLANITTHGLASVVTLQEGYFTAYIVGAIFMTVAVLLFVAGTRCYRRLPGGGTDGLRTMVASVAHSVGNGGGLRAYVCAVGWLAMPLFFAFTVLASLWPASGDEDVLAAAANAHEAACGVSSSTVEGAQHPAARRRLSGGGGGPRGGGLRATLSHVALALGTLSCVCLVLAHRSNDWIKPLPEKRGSRRATPFTLEEVRAGFATIPIIVVVNLSYHMAYNAMNNAFPSQACQMDTRVGGSQLNGAFFNLADAFAIVLLTPLLESFLFPAIGRAKGSPVTLGQKLTVGLSVAAIANIIAAVMEITRRRAPLMCSTAVSECAPNGIHMRDMSAFWMFIPFALIGASEILVNPSMYYYAYARAPPQVRSMVQAFNLFFAGSVSNAFTAMATDLSFPDDLDSGHLEYYYMINVACVLCGILLHFYLTRSDGTVAGPPPQG